MIFQSAADVAEGGGSQAIQKYASTTTTATTATEAERVPSAAVQTPGSVGTAPAFDEHHEHGEDHEQEAEHEYNKSVKSRAIKVAAQMKDEGYDASPEIPNKKKGRRRGEQEEPTNKKV